ncbi:MAG: DUF4442 domain-containing protein [Flavobacteriales bacterium]
MKDLKGILVKAGTNKSLLKMLNPAMRKMIPFNKPHRFNVEEITSERVVVKIPYRRSNLNHLKGIHACALSTACEYSSGLLLLRHLGTKDYRLIMRTLRTEYHYQGKEEVNAIFEFSNERVEAEVLPQLAKEGVVDLSCEIKAYDVSGNHICTTECLWQIKKWDKVKTNV